jgi:hypothetical protein
LILEFLGINFIYFIVANSTIGGINDFSAFGILGLQKNKSL